MYDVDTVERLAIDRLLKLFGAERANVPPQAIGFRVSNPDVEVVDLGVGVDIRLVEIHCGQAVDDALPGRIAGGIDRAARGAR